MTITMGEDEVMSLFEMTDAHETIVNIGKWNVFQQGNRIFVSIDDEYYDVDDPESYRTFELVQATPGIDNSGFDFEEI
jgi:hypothetical protein